MMCLPLCPVCGEPPLFPGQINIAKINKKECFIECSDACHSDEEINAKPVYGSAIKLKFFHDYFNNYLLQ